MLHLKQKLLLFVTISVAITLNTACKADEPIGNIDKLPTDVFFLNDTRWVESSVDPFLQWPNENTYDPETGKLISTLFYGPSRYIHTLSIHKINENEAEVYRTTQIRVQRQIWDLVNQVPIWLTDSVLNDPPVFYGNIRIDDKKVYWKWNIKEAEEILMYDFNLKLNDTFYIKSFKDPFVIYSVDSVQVLDEYRKRYNFITASKHEYFSVIEGIGNTRHFLYTITNPANIDAVAPNLDAIYYKDKLIWGTNIDWDKEE